MNFRKSVQISLILVYLVIIAGAVVRMTGSGMGCPDWPKCFGYYIPPTQVEQLEWKPNHDYQKDQVIILNETLQVAENNFTSSNQFSSANWEVYEKHDYAIFNPTHTWVEYINRLVGALAGLAVLLMAILSFRKWRKNKAITLLSWLTVFLMGFQAWLGATVVYSVLAPVRITLHMVVALIIVAVILYILHLANNQTNAKKYIRSFKLLLIISLVLTLIQVVLGTEVRQFVDERIKELGYEKSEWLSQPNLQFYIHRIFSILVFLVNIFIWLKNKKQQMGYNQTHWILLLILLEIFTGMAMYYLDFPFATQAAHLVIASLLFGLQFYLILQTLNAAKTLKKA